MIIDILTIFPEMFSEVLSHSMMKIAREKKLVEFNIINIRDFTTDKHQKVDDRPFGGGPGMVMMADPVVRAVASLSVTEERARLIMLSPQGKKFNQETARYYAAQERLTLICGHYEGFDERIRLLLSPEELSIGDYVLTGGEIPAMAVVDAVVRLLPGMLGCADSAQEESFETGLLDHPQYTRPREYQGVRVPEVLLSGDHDKIKEWRKRQAYLKTLFHRPDLLKEK